MRWTAIYSTRKYLPKIILGDISEYLENLFRETGYHGRLEVMTDQVDVYANKRKVATYVREG